MARDTKARSVRRDPSLQEGRRDVALQAGRRFFTGSGNDQATRQARALTNALGIGIDAYAGVLERRNVKGASRAAQEAAAGGERDETEKNKGYNVAFDQVEAANDLAIFANELPKLLQSKGWSDLDEDEAQEMIDGYYAGQLAGINPDSVYGQIVAQGILKQNEELLLTHRTVQAEKDQQERRIMIDNEMRADYKANGFLDHAKLMDRLGKLVPGPGGRTSYLESAFDLSEDMGDVEIVNSIPDLFPNGEPTGKTDPNYEPMFDAAKANAVAVADQRKKDADDKWRLDNQTTLAKMRDRDTRMAEASDERVLPYIASGGELGPNGEPRRYSQEQQFQLYQKFGKAYEGAEDARLLLRDWVDSNGIGYSQAETDQAHVDFVAYLQDNLPEALEGASEDAINDYITNASLALGVTNGQLPSVYKDQLGVNLSNPEKFKDAAEMYGQLEAQERGFAETQMDHAQSMKLYAYNRYLADTNGNEQKAIELMGAHDAGRNKQPALQTDIGVAAQLAMDTVTAQPFFTSDFATTTRMAALLDREIRFYVDAGSEPDVAGRYAVEHILRRTRRAGDHVYAPDAGWGNTPQAVYDWQIEEEAKARNVDPDTLSIVPTADPKVVRFASTEETLPSTELEDIVDLTGEYNDAMSVDKQKRKEAHRNTTAELLQKAESRAYAKRYPSRSFGEPSMRASMQEIYRELWRDMDPDKRQRLINDELVDPSQ